jgi:hypothetical protein
MSRSLWRLAWWLGKNPVKWMIDRKRLAGPDQFSAFSMDAICVCPLTLSSESHLLEQILLLYALPMGAEHQEAVNE